MAVKGRVGDEMDPRFNNGPAQTLGLQGSLDSIEYLTIAHIQPGDIGPAEIGDGDSRHLKRQAEVKVPRDAPDIP
jgi:hypothetical protein